MRSGVCWFTEFCNSQCLSHFAAPFFDAQAKTSIVEDCKTLPQASLGDTRSARQQPVQSSSEPRRWAPPPAVTGGHAHAVPKAPSHFNATTGVYKTGSLCVNDPSAGSPTETLLRLLLPLGDKVHSISRNKSEQANSSQSEVFTGSPNR